MTEESAVNGGDKYIEQIDPDDPEYVRQLRRPAEVKEDLKQMDDRSRVSQILKTKAFREELEEIVHDQIKSGPHPASLLALQQISEILLPHSRGGLASGSAASAAIPIADIRGVDSLNYSKAEKMLRCKVASAYRLADLFGWASGFNQFITTRISQDFEHFLLMPHGMLYPEVTASSLIKVNLQGEVLDPGTTTFTVNRKAFALHAAIHAARPDLKTLVHLRSPGAVAVSCMNQGLMPLSQEAMALGEVSYYDYTGCVSDAEESDKMVRCLGPSNRVLVLRNHGIVVGGDCVEDAFQTASQAAAAIDVQLQALQAAGVDNVRLPSEEARKKAFELANPPAPQEKGGRKWRRGEMEFEAYMRRLDNAGYRTGHLYREPFLRKGERRDRCNSDVEIPPSVTSAGQYYEEDRFGSPLKSHFDKQKKAFKSEWLNSPNAYKKEEFDETGTPHPKKITRWVSEKDEKSAGHAVKVENPNQFAPQGDNPKELKEKYKEIRKEYYEDQISAGPQSKILEGMSWEEAQRIKDGHVSGTSDGVIVVGAASKGIIQRDHQHNAVVYKTYYAPNPFDNMTEEEVEKYKKEVQGHGKEPEPEDLTPGPDGRLISTEERIKKVKEGGTTVTTTVKTTTVEVSDQPASPTTHKVHSPVTETPGFKYPTQQTLTYDSEPRRRKARGGHYDDSSSSSWDSPSVLPSPSFPTSDSSHEPPTPTQQDLQRSHSARLPQEQSKQLAQELQDTNFGRSKSERKGKKKKNVNGEQQAEPAGSPTKSTSSGEGLIEEHGSPTREAAAVEESSSPSKEGKKKKKRGFRIPSFSKKKEGKEGAAATPAK